KNISFIPKSGETGTVYAVKFIFPGDNSSYKYRIGMAGDLSFVTKRKENVLYTSSKFIKSQNNKKYVMVKRNGKEEKKEVTTGMETDTDTEITSGVAPGETVYN
ncbi:efflux RND transporter periplasmic adaptor subunit, partial [Candidatus Gottesmanbacteria bacterium]|nr:efflux RND transporter periplasmic adaptor subunit [Candidatus Gottesmanbacteria bacterium]